MFYVPVSLFKHGMLCEYNTKNMVMDSKCLYSSWNIAVGI